MPFTSTGTLLLAVELLPSWPYQLGPQQFTFPEARAAQGALESPASAVAGAIANTAVVAAANSMARHLRDE
jgi:hypothetical protein